MIAASTILLLFLVVILLVFRGHIFLYLKRLVQQRVRGSLPGGPFSWPLVGARGIDAQAPWETLTKWAKIYGPVTSFFYGTEYTVVLSDLESIRSAMKHPAFAGRPLHHSSKEYFGQGIGFAEGEVWKRHRKLVVSSMRVLGNCFFLNFYWRVLCNRTWTVI